MESNELDLARERIAELEAALERQGAELQQVRNLKHHNEEVLGRALKEREDAMATVLSNVASVPEWHQAAQNSREVGSWTIAELPTLLALDHSLSRDRQRCYIVCVAPLPTYVQMRARG